MTSLDVTLIGQITSFFTSYVLIGFLLLVLNSNVDGEYGHNIFNVLVEVNNILLETGSWLKDDKSFFRE